MKDQPFGNGKRIAYRTCPLCEAGCGLELVFEEGRVTGIRGDRQDVLSRGYFCPKGAALGALHNDPDRLRHPLVREGRRRDGAWRRATWEEAFEAVREGLSPIMEERGRDAVGVYLGNPNVHTMAGAIALKAFLRALRSKSLFSASSVDQIAKQAACGLMFGSPALIPVPDVDRTDCLVIMGANPLVSNGSLCTAPDFPGRLRALKARGGKLIVIDPCRTATAKLADEHHFIRPGTDALLLFAIVHVLFEEDLVSLGGLERHVSGLGAVRDLARPFTPEAAGPACGIDPAAVRRTAREIATAPSAVVYGRMGTSTVAFGTLAGWLVDVVNVLTGNFDRPGGAMFSTPAHVPLRGAPGGKGFKIGRWRSRARGLREVMGELPVAALADEIETPGEGRIQAMITVAGNPVLSTPNSRRLDMAFGSLDFMASVDFYLNETTRHARVILPPASPLAHAHYDFVFHGLSVRNAANYSPPAVPRGPGEADTWEILLKLALIVAGQDPKVPVRFLEDLMVGQMVQAEAGKSRSSIAGRDPSEILRALGEEKGPERMLDFMLRTGPYGDGFGKTPDGLTLERLKTFPHGLALGPLEPRIPNILRTPSAKIELAPSPLVNDVPRLTASLDRGRDDGLVLIGRRHLRSNNSWMHNLEALVKGKDRCTLQMNPRDARERGIKEGDRVRISSRVGALRAPVEVTADVMPGVVSLPHGWGHDLPGTRLSVAALHPGVNSNLLADEERIDPVSGNAVLNGIPVVATLEEGD